MRRLLYVAAILASVLLVAADKKPVKVKEPAPSSAQIQLWIKQLGDDDFKVREEATRNLIEAGGVAFDALNKATISNDVEVKQRALRITQQIEKKTVAELQRFGVSLDFDDRGRAIRADYNTWGGLINGEKVLVHLKGLANLQELDAKRISDNVLKHIKEVKSLRKVTLKKSFITDEGMAYFGEMKNLETLVLGSENLTDAGLVHLTGLQNLHTLQLPDIRYRNFVFESGIEHLKKINKLETLHIRTTNGGVKKLKGFINLKCLRVRGKDITESGLEPLKSLTNLEELIAPIYTDAGLMNLKGLTKLQRLYLSRTNITNAGLVHLKGLTDLQELVLRETKVTDAGLVHLKGLTNLDFLNLSHTKITDDGLVHLKKLTKLQRLYLTYTKVSDAGLEHLKGLTNLEDLKLMHTEVTEEGMMKLKKVLPNCFSGWKHP